MKIFPNPGTAESVYNISFIGFEREKVELIIQNVEGKECYSETIDIVDYNQINTLTFNQKLVSGTYFVRIISAHKSDVVRLMIK